MPDAVTGDEVSFLLSLPQPVKQNMSPMAQDGPLRHREDSPLGSESASSATVTACWNMDDEERLSLNLRRRQRRQRRRLEMCSTRLSLPILCLVSLSGWIAAFWSTLSAQMHTTNAGYASLWRQDVNDRNGGSTRLVTTEDGDATSKNDGTHATTSRPANGLSVDEILDGSWKAAPHTLRWVAKGDEVLLIEIAETNGSANNISTWRIAEGRESKTASFRMESLALGRNDTLGSTYIYNGREITAEDILVCADAQNALILSNKTQVWRRSFRALYWLLDLNSTSNAMEALDPAHPEAEAQLAILSPKGDAVAFVRDNNLHLRSMADAHVEAITADTDPAVRNGIPGWGYEEEVLESHIAMWWSPRDGLFLAFLRTDEFMMQIYTMQLFAPPATGQDALYPAVRPLQYPKAGTANPVVTLQVYDTRRRRLLLVDFPGQLPDDDRVVFSVVWLTAQQLLVKHTNRESSILMVFLVDIQDTEMSTVTATLVRSEAGAGGCWVEPVRDVVQFVPADPTRQAPDDGYVDMVVFEGYNHLAYFTPLHAPTPTRMLTSGPWEVVDAPTAVDATNGWVYFIATRKQHPDERHLYRASLEGSDVRDLTDQGRPAYYSASFAQHGRYALLRNEGPDSPHTSLVALTVDGMAAVSDVQSNHALVDKVKVSGSSLPQRRLHHIDLGGGVATPIMELLPPNFDPTRRYPVVFSPYGGPGSQTVTQRFRVDFAALLASRGYVVVAVDGRGTGLNGRAARCVVQDRLGHFEALDQIAAAQLWAAKDYVDADRLAIWGWSFGGFLTLKTLEMDAGRTFAAGIAVAPVTDWRLYGEHQTQAVSAGPLHEILTSWLVRHTVHGAAHACPQTQRGWIRRSSHIQHDSPASGATHPPRTWHRRRQRARAEYTGSGRQAGGSRRGQLRLVAVSGFGP